MGTNTREPHFGYNHFRLRIEQLEQELAEARAAVAEAVAAEREVIKTVFHYVKDWMDFGERPCNFCGHHHKHSNDCPFLLVEAIVRSYDAFEAEEAKLKAAAIRARGEGTADA